MDIGAAELTADHLSRMVKIDPGDKLSSSGVANSYSVSV